MWNDNDTNIDYIDFSHLVESVTSIISNDDLLPCTIGLYGDWGSGKSSLMRMIESRFEDEDDVLVVKFNGWLFEGYDDAKSVLMGTILDEVISNRTLSAKGKELTIRLFKKINWMKVATASVKSGLGLLALGPIGLTLGATDAADIYDKMSKVDFEGYIDPENEEKKSIRLQIREFHEDFSELLEETKIKKLIVFIDDLDRCNPATVIDTLEAIKLFLFVDNSAFVIGADERLIKYAVKKRFPEIQGTDRFDVGRDYLEKLIQFPVRIPQLSQSEMELYINLLFTKLGITNKEGFESVRDKVITQKRSSPFSSSYNMGNMLEVFGDIELGSDLIDKIRSDLGLSSSVTPILTQGLLGNPRQTKRFLNTLLMRMNMAKARRINIDKRVLAKLMIFEYFKTETFKRISLLQAREEGKPQVIRNIEEFILQKEKGEKKRVKKGGKKETSIELEEEASTWMSDEQMQEWFAMEPPLKDVDLRPYFYFSRDRLGSMPASIQRMSPIAQETYNLLIAGSETEKKSGLDKLSALSPAEAASIFDSVKNEFARKIGSDESSGVLKVLVELCGKRPELIPQLFTFLPNVPMNSLDGSFLLHLIASVKTSQYRQLLISYVEKVSVNEQNVAIARIAKKRLEKLNN